jgi:small subunit ribosomal protein S4
MKIGPKYKIGKRLGSSVFEQLQTQRFQLSQARSESSGKRRAPKSDYAKQFIEKQRVRFTYGITEKQFKNYITKAMEGKSSNPAETLYRSLESRLDNTVYRMGLANTRRKARQLVSHGHIMVNGRKVTIPSFVVSANDVVSVREGSKTSVLFTELAAKLKDHTTPSWVSFNADRAEGKVVGTPVYVRSELAYDLVPVLEFYSR